MSQLLEGLKAIHNAGFVHADLKPTNLVFGFGDSEEAMKSVHIVDFGLTKKYTDYKGRHVEQQTNQGTRGTMSYMSIHTQQGITMSRRDDMESIAYVMIMLAKGSLPWNRLKSVDKPGMYRETL